MQNVTVHKSLPYCGSSNADCLD